MPRDFPDAPESRRSAPDAAAQPYQVPDDEDALDDAILLAELRYAVEGARTQAEDRYRCDPDWRDRLGRIHARWAH
jgi:hypothetical protein